MNSKDNGVTDRPYTGRHTKPITDKQKLEDLLIGFGVNTDLSDLLDSCLVKAKTEESLIGVYFQFDDDGKFMDLGGLQ